MSESGPVYSVIVPVWNKRPHVARAIRSVLEQTYSDFELLVVDDASTDGSMAVAEEFTDPRMRILGRDETQRGVSATRNLGVREARADWVSFLDADDEWLPEYLTTIDRLRRSHPECEVFGAGWLIAYGQDAVANNEYYHQFHAQGDHQFGLEEFLANMISGVPPFSASTTAVSRDLCRAVGGFPEGGENTGEDIDTWFRIMMTGASAVWASSVVAIYHRDATNMLTKTMIPKVNRLWSLVSIAEAIEAEDDRRRLQLLHEYRRRVKKDAVRTAAKAYLLRLPLEFVLGRRRGDQLWLALERTRQASKGRLISGEKHGLVV